MTTTQILSHCGACNFKDFIPAMSVTAIFLGGTWSLEWDCPMCRDRRALTPATEGMVREIIDGAQEEVEEVAAEFIRQLGRLDTGHVHTRECAHRETA